MEVITLNGKEFVKASTAAREVGYTSDYVGQLCRSGSISAERVGRNWYVDRKELREHKTDKKRNARSKAREQVRKAVKETVAKNPKDTLTQETEKRFDHHYLTHSTDTQYVADQGPLIPDIKKTANNKAFIEHVVEDVPEIIEREQRETVKTEYASAHKVPVTIKRNVSKKMSLRKRKAPSTLKRQKKSIQEPQPQIKSYWPEQDKSQSVPVRRKESFYNGVITILLALTIGTILVGTTSRLSVQMSDSLTSGFNQISDSYSLDINFVLSK